MPPSVYPSDISTNGALSHINMTSSKLTDGKEQMQNQKKQHQYVSALAKQENKTNGTTKNARKSQVAIELAQNGTLSQNGHENATENNTVLKNRNMMQVSSEVIENGHSEDEKENMPERKMSNGIKLVPYMDKPPESMKCLGINGYWYNISTFIDKHPGGPVIEEFVGYDATDAYRSFHKQDVLKQRHFRPIGHYKENWLEFNKAMHKLHEDLLQEGFYKVNYYWYAMKISLTFVYISAVFALVINFADSLYVLSLAAALLAFFWQQNGFLMHDFMHSQVTQNKAIDEILGVWTGTVCIGISASWWKDEHMYHHALTCMVDYANNFYDPQMKEDVWVQSTLLFPFFQTRLSYLLIKIQHITFVPICMFIGRIAIIIDSFHLEKRWFEWLALFMHATWLLYLLSFIPTWEGLVYFYCLAHTLQGILHVQLLANHYSKKFNFRDEIITDWYRKQVVTNINIKNPTWLDFFHGGLNFHIEHHCFPRAPRNRLREISYRIKKVCAEHDVPYDESGFFEILRRTLVHLKKTGDLFVLKDPR